MEMSIFSGKYIPSLGYEIHTKNQESDNVRIPLKGMAIGDGLVDPIHQWFYGEFLYQNGFIDEMDKEELNDMSDEAVKLLQEGTQESNLKATLVMKFDKFLKYWASSGGGERVVIFVLIT